MRLALLPYLICPKCSSNICLDRSVLRNDEIWQGTLCCVDRGHSYPIDDGVPNFVYATEDRAQAQVGDSYSRKWKALSDYGFTAATTKFQHEWYLQKFGWGQLGRLSAFLSKKQFVLDAGCGLGRDLVMYAERTKGIVFGVDISESVKEAHKRCGSLPNVHIVQADMTHMPFRAEFFDFVACDQALHHTPNTHEALLKLVGHTKKHGQLAIYVYKQKSAAREFADDLMRKYTTDMEYMDCFAFASACTEFGRAVSQLDLKLQREIYWKVFKCFWDPQYDFKTNVMINLDWYHPKYAWRHTLAEVRRWFKEANLRVLNTDVSESGISLRGYKK